MSQKSMSDKKAVPLSFMIDDEFDMVLVGMYKADREASYLKMLYGATENPPKLESFIMEDVSLRKQFGCDLSVILDECDRLVNEYEQYLSNWSILEQLLNNH